MSHLVMGTPRFGAVPNIGAVAARIRQVGAHPVCRSERRIRVESPLDLSRRIFARRSLAYATLILPSESIHHYSSLPTFLLDAFFVGFSW